MVQAELFSDILPSGRIDIGANLSLDFIGEQKVILYNRQEVVKVVDLKDKIAKKLFIVEAIELGATKSLLAQALPISRQTIHNYMYINKFFGLEGLVGGYDPNQSKSLRKQRELNKKSKIEGNKAEIVAEIRKEELKTQEQLELDFTFGGEEPQEVPQEYQPFNEEYDWKRNRYAGVFAYLITLTIKFKWLNLIMGYFGEKYRIFMIFVLMSARNIKSIEQLKHVRMDEAGAVLGMDKVPSKTVVWQWFYQAAKMNQSVYLLKDFFRYQISAGIVAVNLWFSDGHLLPYTGKAKVHYAYNTQRQMPVPGRTNIVTCDPSGRIVDFQIEEGKGNLFYRIIDLKKEWEDVLGESPVMVMDREVFSAKNFSEFIEEDVLFVTWDKNIDTKELQAINDDSFTEEFIFNDKTYNIFEGEKSFKIKKEDGTDHEFNLRRIYIWNRKTNHRTCALAWTKDKDVSTKECAQAILSRWGASENTFKHISDRHPFHYHPGFKMNESEKQDIANPEIKECQKKIKVTKKELDKAYKNFAESKDAYNKDGSLRKNNAKQSFGTKIEELKSELSELTEEKKELPERIDVSGLEDYRSFNKIDNEGKNLFDFVTASVWNARKQMTDWLLSFYGNKNEHVDLFYAITESHGWIKSEKNRVTVRLEPLQQPLRRAAQEQLCRKLTALSAHTPMGKWLVIEVGPCPIKKG